MSDIKCKQCGEPWDTYGVSHGDMTEHEAKQFRAGKGCPCCRPVPRSPYGRYADELPGNDYWG